MSDAGIDKRRTLTVGLLWHSFHSDNLGVGALSQSQLAICTAAAQQLGIDLQFVVFGTRGGSCYGLDDQRIRVGSKIVLRELINGRSSFQADLTDCDLVLDIGEGDSFADIYGFKRFLTLILTKIIVLAKRKPLILSPQTIGPFATWYSRWLAVRVMKRCDMVFARDTMSYEYLKKCGIQRNAAEVVDVAFCLPFTAPAPQTEQRIRIGINVSGLLFSGGYSGSNQFGLAVDYPELVRALLREFTKNTANEVWLIPHVIPKDLPRDDDRVISEELRKEFPSINIAPEFRSPSDAKSFIATMDFMTGARMHACIAAFSAGVPVVPVAYSRKFNGLFSMLGYKWVADATSQTTEQALELILDGFTRRVELAAVLVEGNKIAKMRLDAYTVKLVSLFSSVLA